MMDAPTTLSRWPLLALLALVACETVPTGPSVMVLPGRGSTFDRFRFDDADCRQYAQGQIGGTTADQAGTDSVARSAALGVAVGAAAGALLGGHRGAGEGAGMGLVVGTAAGTGAARSSAYAAQNRYDAAYLQCMYYKGHQVPTSGGAMIQAPPAAAPLPDNIPPPPRGTPPPPPPDAPR